MREENFSSAENYPLNFPQMENFSKNFPRFFSGKNCRFVNEMQPAKRHKSEMSGAGSDWLHPQIKGLLLDISGVLRDGDVTIPNSVDALQRLVDSGIPFRLVTNESQVTAQGSVDKLRACGFKGLSVDKISSPAPILIAKLKAEGYNPHLLLHPGAKGEFLEAGLGKGDANDLPNCVVIGDAAEEFNYDNMNAAFNALLGMRERGLEPKLFTLGKGRYYRDKGGLMLDVGPFCAALEYATDVVAELVGKPSPDFFAGALAALNSTQPEPLRPCDVVMIGDDLMGDVGGAQAAGFRGVLVRTGKYRPADEIGTGPGGVTPDAIVDDLGAAINLILQNSKQ